MSTSSLTASSRRELDELRQQLRQQLDSRKVALVPRDQESRKRDTPSGLVANPFARHYVPLSCDRPLNTRRNRLMFILAPAKLAQRRFVEIRAALHS